jgi:DNA-binding NtrC family response regulator
MNLSVVSPHKPAILVVDDEQSILQYMRTILELDDYSVETARSGEEAIRRLQHDAAPALIFLDIRMPGLDGLETLAICRKMRPQQRIVVVSCVTDVSTVAQATRLGAMDYLAKPFYKADIEAVLKRCLAPAQDESANIFAASAQPPEIAQAHVEPLGDEMFFLALSPAMRRLRAQLPQIAKVDIPVLLLGESGVGKEVIARLIHKLSPRARKPLMKINCAAVPPDLLESELFGYEAGAFTGATRSKPGKFQLCHRGTILLDEIGEMHPMLQAKLLHVLQDGKFSPLGGRSQVAANVRVLAATNIDVPKAIANKAMREDLYYRLNSFTLKIPPLRERTEEISLLLKQFMGLFSEKYAAPAMDYSQKLVDACLRYHWPGNVRELANFVRRFVILRDEGQAISELEMKGAERARRGASGDPPVSSDLKLLVRGLKGKAELKAITEALAATNWNRRLAAERLNISYKALLYKMKAYELVPREEPEAGQVGVQSQQDRIAPWLTKAAS